jgi:hypothetical protein
MQPGAYGSNADVTVALVRLVDVHEAVDALYRFAEGQDRRNAALFKSAFAPDAIVDFTGPAGRFGITLAPFTGVEEIAATILGTTAGLTTTHTVTNPRVAVEGDRATLHALVEAQHVSMDDHRRQLLLKNLYTVQLSRSGAQWVVGHMLIESMWFTGDPTVLFPSSAGSTSV